MYGHTCTRSSVCQVCVCVFIVNTGTHHPPRTRSSIVGPRTVHKSNGPHLFCNTRTHTLYLYMVLICTGTLASGPRFDECVHQVLQLTNVLGFAVWSEKNQVLLCQSNPAHYQGPLKSVLSMWMNPTVLTCYAIHVCVCLSMLSWSQYYFEPISTKFGTDVRNLKRKNPFFGGQNPLTVSPIFTQFYPKLAPFSTGDLKCFSDIIYGPIIAVHSSNNVSWRPPTPECEIWVKGGVARVT